MVLLLCEDDSAYPFPLLAPLLFFLAAFVVLTQRCGYQEPMHQNALLQVKMSEREEEVMSQWKMNIGGQTVNEPPQLVCVYMFLRLVSAFAYKPSWICRCK